MFGRIDVFNNTAVMEVMEVWESNFFTESLDENGCISLDMLV